MRILICMLIFLLASCSTVGTQEALSQKTGQTITTYIGGQVFKVQRSSGLPNAFGKADIFGGKINRGYTELRYKGLSPDGKLIFIVNEVGTQSNETTMSRHGSSTSYINIQRWGNNVSGTISTDQPVAGATETLPENSTQFLIDPTNTNDFTIAAVHIHIISSTNTSLTYQLEN